MKRSIAYSFLACLTMACSSSNDKPISTEIKPAPKGEYIYRKHDEYVFNPESPVKNVIEPYPWERGNSGKYARITKEYFRCKGSSLNPLKIVTVKDEIQRLYDCGGSEKHSLPLRNNKEFIYPILINLANYVQTKTGKRVVITCGHRCPEHNAYSDPAPSNQYSKHMIGAEMSFYVQGMEESPEKVIKMLQEYYKETPKYKDLKEYQEFKRWEKGDVDVSTPPWYNKEIFIKLHKKKENRNFDNRHPYPYISVQVRYDMDTQEKIIYTWDKAFHNYHRF